MILPYGIAGGYYYADKEPERPSVDKQDFLKVCEEISEKIGVEMKEHTQVWGNFYAAKFDFEKPVFVLINKFHPYVAFADYDDFGQFGSGFPINFTDHPVLAEMLEDRYMILTQEELDESFRLLDQPHLRDIQSVREQVDFYKPKKVGDVIFNCWD